MSFQIDLGAWNQVFIVPAAVVDQHLKLAGSAQLKILLWLLRHAGEAVEPEQIGAVLGLSRADVCDAMQYWIAAGVVAETNQTLRPAAPAAAPAPAPAPVQQPAAPEPESPPAAVRKDAPRPRPRQLNPMEIASRIQDNEDIRALIDAAEQNFGRPLSTPELGALVNLHDWDGLPGDVIMMIVQYAVDNGKTNMRYIEKMAVSWAAEGINTHEKAEEKIRLLDDRETVWTQVSRLFGIDKRQPSAAEYECAARWVHTWGFDDAMLREAYNRCIDNTGKVKFGYIDKILERWHSEGIRTIDQAHAENRKPAQAGAFSRPAADPNADRSYDLEAFERMTLYGNSQR